MADRKGGPPGPPPGPGGTPPPVAEGPSRRRILLVASGVAAALVAIAVAMAVLRPWEKDETTDSSTATATASAVAPLTGSRVSGDRAALLEEPALAVKIDASPQANGQWGLARADLVIEEQVEGISRLLAVWHSDRAEEVGPVRSARSTDVSLLPMLVEPLFGHSGANEGVLAQLADAGGFQDVSQAVVPEAYRRESSRSVPHNLLADPAELQEAAGDPGSLPVPLFGYRPTDGPVPGSPAPGLAVRVGSTARFVWDEALRGWRRWSHGESQVDQDGDQIAPVNVVVLETDYVPSAADPVSPEAVTVGEGDAWVYSSGAVAQGRWRRGSPRDPWDLRDADGTAMTLEPGSAWLVLATAPPQELPPDIAEALLAEAGDGE